MLFSQFVGRCSRFARLVVSHPSWAFYLVTDTILQWGGQGNFHHARANEYNQRLTSLEQAIASITHSSSMLVESTLREMPSLQPDQSGTSSIPSEWSGSPEFVRLIYSICRLAKPEIVVETGVARGMSSFYILKALSQNGIGHLYSIDLPLSPKAVQSTGCLVPQELRSRWMLRLGPSEYILPKILKDLSQVDLFICDSSHTWRCQRKEYRYALSSLRHGGYLVSDDIGNDALFEIAEAHRATYYIIPQPKDNPIGILVKP